MILKNQIEWALHCCSVLAGMPPEAYVSTKALAEFHGVPKEYLSKALQHLSQAGIVESTLGPAGGYRLARKTRDITFLDIVEAVEGRRSTFACTNIRKNNPCRPGKVCEGDDKPCSIARVMWEADAAWRKTLQGVRLSDLAKTVAKEVPADLLAAGHAWLLAKT